ncbi:flagellin [Alteribacillus sp. YIM 98480]|uniref:flagellin n=1 Tax=Alteribacillus sp. YIM 98480 TaxID=2606599 RepID=UPI002714596A|nr:flagellin [Alteribacillus sp. YIM 98480]
MKINHNIPALNANRHLQQNQTKLSKTQESLASGMRINGAADDAAGLAISEKMRSQIRGLSQAERNVLDGVSLIQTAEGGLTAIHEQLQRMRELTVQAKNDTLIENDKKNIQKEIDQLKQGIDDVAHDTDFNGVRPLIKGQAVQEGSPPSNSGEADVVFVIDRTGSMGSHITNVRENLQAFQQRLDKEVSDVRFGLVTYSDINIEDPTPVTKINFSSGEFTTDLEELDTKLGEINPFGGGDTEESGLEAIMDNDNGALSFDYRNTASKQLIKLTDAPNHTSDTTGGSDYTSEQVSQELKKENIQVSIISNANSTLEGYEKLKELASTNTDNEEEKRYYDISGDFEENLEVIGDSIGNDVSGNNDIIHIPDLLLQIGANEGEQFEVALTDARIKSLGMDNVQVIDPSQAEDALERIDQAIETVSSERAKWGTYQNRLEHITNNLGVYRENLTASESNIRDSDMALKMTEFTKHNILNQSGTAMLAQANQLPQGILQLLQ